MKIGILTFHYAINYGAVLQTYATYRLLKDAGYEVEVIDYHNSMIDNDYRNFEFKFSRLMTCHIKHIVIGFLGPLFYKLRKKKFNDFIKNNIKISAESFRSPINSIYGYDAYVIGSDQVWNTQITHGFDNVYWGEFSKDICSKTIGWSVSTNIINLKQDKEILKRLHNFTSISTRELQLKKFVEDISGKSVEHTLDPTLVLDAEKWKKLCKDVKEEKYVLIFAIMGTEHFVYPVARACARKYNLQIVTIKAFSDGKIMHGEKQYCGPDEFLSYIHNAEYIFTSSFHGTAFSLIFQKQFFCVFEDNEHNVRIESLLSALNLSDRILRNDFKELASIDYRDVTPKLKEMAKLSKEYLYNSINRQ